MAFAKIISRGTSNFSPCLHVRILFFVALIISIALIISCGEANLPEARDLSTPLATLPQNLPPNETVSSPGSTVAFTSSQAGINAAGDAEEAGQTATDKIPRLTVLGIPQFLDVIVVEVTNATTIRVETEDRTAR